MPWNMRTAINPNTIQRAYKDLETEGYIYSVSGKGSFVEDISNIVNKRKEEVLAQLAQIIIEVKDSGGTREECEELVKKIFES